MPLPVTVRASSASTNESPSSSIRPFLKWAGGKRQLLPQLRRFIPTDFGAYYEPFVGSGAMFFDMYATGVLNDRWARLVDTNLDLIGCYRALSGDAEGVIRTLKELTHGHEAAPIEHYYRIRDQRFNPARRGRNGELAAKYPVELAAMFIYLNRTGFNGLFRLNSHGAFNVPAGRYTNPRICDVENLRAVAQALRSPKVVVEHGQYESVLQTATANDFVYFDPPYAPLSTTARFTSYTADGFTDNDQRRLREVVLALIERGCWVVLSNSTAPIITELYAADTDAQRAGLRAYRVPAKRAINSNPMARGDVMEFIITNVRPAK